ncbi:MAG: hypothetical protein M3Q58_01370 [Bacteroidota bacterium]|nr:hypothetical protein [Bacteroidota bacterium]
MESNKNIKVNINRPGITPQEIKTGKNFQSVLYNYKKMTKPFFKSPKFFSGLLVMAVVIALVIIQVKDENSKKPVVNPPIPELALKPNYYNLDAAKGGIIKHSTGSKISVPAEAFVDAKGTPVKGDVKVSYREFHHPLDIIFSGIPMAYDSSGVQYHFETAGMMEILAYDKNGEKVFLAQGKEIDVSMASADDRTFFNLYQLDTVGGNWLHLGKDKVEVVQADPVMLQDQADVIAVAGILENNGEILPLKKSRDVLEKPVKPKKINPERFKFVINVFPEEFPELAEYKSVFFEIGEENENFDPKLANIIWEDATLAKGVPGKNFKLNLVKGKQRHELIVYPVFEAGDYEMAMAEYNKRFDNYEESFKKRLDGEKRKQDEFAQLQKEREEERKMQVMEQQRIALENANALAIQQRQNRIAERTLLAEAQVRNTRINTEYDKIWRTFSISKMGIFNCDRPHLYPSGAQVLASFKTKSGEDLFFNQIYLVEKDRSAVFMYNYGMLKQFKFNPLCNNYLIAVSSEGKPFFFLPDGFSKVPSNGDYCFRMKSPEKELKDAEEIKAYLNL